MTFLEKEIERLLKNFKTDLGEGCTSTNDAQKNRDGNIAQRRRSLFGSDKRIEGAIFISKHLKVSVHLILISSGDKLRVSVRNVDRLFEITEFSTISKVTNSLT